MSLFKAGDVIKIREDARRNNGPLQRMFTLDREYTVKDLVGEGCGRVVIEGTYDTGSVPVSGVAATCFKFVRCAPAVRKARNTDPETSKAAAKKPRASIRAAVLALIANGPCSVGSLGWTGKELAGALLKPLNSVTPRFKELTEANAIKDSGKRRDGQIVWVAV